LQPARSRRSRRDCPGPTAGNVRFVQTLDHGADGRGDIPRSAHARCDRPSPRRVDRPRRALRSHWPAPQPPAHPLPPRHPAASRKSIDAAGATDLKGHDLAETARAFDRKTAEGFRRLNGWIGYAEEHGIVLDFADHLAGLAANTPLILCLAGWVEYPHSQTNY